MIGSIKKFWRYANKFSYVLIKISAQNPCQKTTFLYINKKNDKLTKFQKTSITTILSSDLCLLHIQCSLLDIISPLY